MALQPITVGGKPPKPKVDFADAPMAPPTNPYNPRSSYAVERPVIGPLGPNLAQGGPLLNANAPAPIPGLARPMDRPRLPVGPGQAPAGGVATTAKPAPYVAPPKLANIQLPTGQHTLTGSLHPNPATVVPNEIIPPGPRRVRPINTTGRASAPPNAAGHVEVAGPGSVALDAPPAQPNFRLPDRPIGALPSPPTPTATLTNVRPAGVNPPPPVIDTTGQVITPQGQLAGKPQGQLAAPVAGPAAIPLGGPMPQSPLPDPTLGNRSYPFGNRPPPATGPNWRFHEDPGGAFRGRGADPRIKAKVTPRAGVEMPNVRVTPTATQHLGNAARAAARGARATVGGAGAAAQAANRVGGRIISGAPGAFRGSLPALALQAIAHPEDAAWAAGHPGEALSGFASGIGDLASSLGDGRARAFGGQLLHGDADSWYGLNEAVNPVMWGAMAGKTIGEEAGHAIKGDGTLPQRLSAAFNAPAPTVNLGATGAQHAAELNEGLAGINAQAAARDEQASRAPAPGGLGGKIPLGALNAAMMGTPNEGPAPASPSPRVQFSSPSPTVMHGPGDVERPATPQGQAPAQGTGDRVLDSMMRSHDYLVRSGAVGQGSSMADLQDQYHANVLGSSRAIQDYRKGVADVTESGAKTKALLNQARPAEETLGAINRDPHARAQSHVVANSKPEEIPAYEEQARRAAQAGQPPPREYDQSNWQEGLAHPYFNQVRQQLTPVDGRVAQIEQMLDAVHGFPGVAEGNPLIRSLISSTIRAKHLPEAIGAAGKSYQPGGMWAGVFGPDEAAARRLKTGAQLGLWPYQQ